jgi:hypothetical protein
MTKRKSVNDTEMEVAFFQYKLQDELDRRLEITLKDNCFLIDGKVLMMCTKCKKLKERTTKNFVAKSGDNNFLTSRAGHEFVTTICRVCNTEKNSLFRQTEVGFINSLLSSYKQYGLTVNWFYEKLKEQEGFGTISGIKLKLVLGEINSAGIHKHDNNKDHTPDNCFLEVQEINVPQHEAIPCLFCSWKELYNCILHQSMFPDQQDNSKHLEYIRSQYRVIAKDIGIIGFKVNTVLYCKQLRDRHFPTILRNAIQRHIGNDIRLKLFHLPTNISRSNFLKIVYDNSIQQLEKQLWKCGYTNINLTFENIWTRFSFERIDDDLPHFTQTGELTNIVFICRLLNTTKKLSQQKIIDYFLHQNLIPVPDCIRFKIDPNSSLDLVAPRLWTQREIDLLQFTSLKTNNTLSCDYCFLKNQIKNRA